jgi:hypothetical protein
MFPHIQMYFSFFTKYFILASLDPNYLMAVDNESKPMLRNFFYILINEFEHTQKQLEVIG